MASAEYRRTIFTEDFLASLPERSLATIVAHIKRDELINDPPNRNYIEMLWIIAQVSKGSAGLDALSTILGIVRSRNTSLAVPKTILNRLSDLQLQAVENESVRLEKLRRRSAIEKYPSFYFEMDDIEACFEIYMKSQMSPKIDITSRVCAFGSCFAVNIARHLRLHGITTHTFELGELVNNAFTNRRLIEYIIDDRQPPDAVEALQPGFTRMVYDFKKNLVNATHVIFTIGLSLAFYDDQDRPLCDLVYSYRRMHYEGYRMRPIRIEDNMNEVKTIIDMIRRINPKIQITVSLSPVPLDGILDMGMSVIEADCLSKSIGRATIGYLKEFDPNLFYYFPSYELVRWVGANKNIPLFGGSQNDGATRHVSKEIISNILDIFISNNCILSEQY